MKPPLILARPAATPTVALTRCANRWRWTCVACEDSSRAIYGSREAAGVGHAHHCTAKHGRAL